MNPSDSASAITVALVAVVLLASGPLAGGAIQPSGAPTTVDDGTATVATVDVPTDDLHVSAGRFGTEVGYLRVPDARVDLATVSDHPRIVYRIEVPALDADLATTRIVTDHGRYRLHVRDQGLHPDRLAADSYDATVSVRVQSFAVDRTVFERNVTVEVRR